MRDAIVAPFFRCAAGVFTLHGHDVTLCEETGVCEQNIQDILDRGGFELTGAAGGADAGQFSAVQWVQLSQFGNC